MQYDVKTPSEYINALPNDWKRKTITQLRKLIKSKAPKIKEGINYKMLSYGDAKGIIFHLNAQKNYVSLYVGDAKKVDPDGKLLKGLDVGKGCIRFKKSVLINDTNIEEFIALSIKMWQQGKDIGC